MRDDSEMPARSRRFDIAKPLAAAYRLVTREEPSARVRAALEQFPAYAIGTVLARLLSVLAQLYIARHLGPAEFGRFSLGLAIALVLSTPMQGAWGAAFVRFTAARPSGTPPWHLVRAVSLLTALSSAIVLLLALLAQAPVGAWLSIPPAVYRLGIATAAATTIWFLAKGICQGLQAWRRLVCIEITWGALVLLVPIAAQTALGALDWRVIGVFAGAYLASSLFALPYWLAAPQEPVRPHIARLWDFGKYLGPAALIMPILLSSDCFLVNRAAGLHALGHYQAYALPAFGLATFVSGLVNRFLFPLFNLGKRAAFRRLFEQALPWAVVVFIPVAFAAGSIAIGVLGYPYFPWVLAGATTGAFAFCIMSFLNYLAATDAARGPRVVLTTNLLACAIFYPTTITLLPAWPLAAPFVGYTLAFGAGAALTFWHIWSADNA